MRHHDPPRNLGFGAGFCKSKMLVNVKIAKVHKSDRKTMVSVETQ